MKCKYCGNDMGEDAVFCNNCGKKSESVISLEKDSDKAEELRNDDVFIDTEEKPPEISEEYIPPTLPENQDIPQEETQDTQYFENTIYKDSRHTEKTGFGKLVCSFFVMIPALVLFVCVSLCFCVKLGVSGKTSANAVKNMKTSVLMDTESNGENFSDIIYDFIDFGNINDEGISKSQFRDFMVNSDFLDFASEKVGLYVNYIINGKGTEPTVTTNEMVEFFKRNSDSAEKAFNYSMKKGDYNAIRKQLDRKEAAANLLISSWSVKTDFNFGKLNYVFQYITLGIFTALTVVLFIWIAVILDRKAKYVLGFYGNIFFFGGIIILLAGILSVPGSAVIYIYTGELLFYAGSTMLVPFALFASATGLFDITVGVIFKSIKKLIKKREKLALEKTEKS